MRSNNKLAISVLSLVLLVSYLAVGAFAIPPLSQQYAFSPLSLWCSCLVLSSLFY